MLELGVAGHVKVPGRLSKKPMRQDLVKVLLCATTHGRAEALGPGAPVAGPGVRSRRRRKGQRRCGGRAPPLNLQRQRAPSRRPPAALFPPAAGPGRFQPQPRTSARPRRPTEGPQGRVSHPPLGDLNRGGGGSI